MPTQNMLLKSSWKNVQSRLLKKLMCFMRLYNEIRREEENILCLVYILFRVKLIKFKKEFIGSCLNDERCILHLPVSGGRLLYIRHTSSCMCVGCVRSPESLTYVSSSGFSHLPPSCNSNYLGYRYRLSGKG